MIIRVYRLENCYPPNHLSCSTPPSLPCVKVQYIQTVCGWEGVGVLIPVGDHILQEFNTLYLTRFRTYKIARPSNKNLGWEGGSDRLTPAEKSLYRSIFLDDAIFIVYAIQHCFTCRPSDSTVSADAGIEPRTVVTSALAVRRFNHSARSHPQMTTFCFGVCIVN